MNTTQKRVAETLLASTLKINIGNKEYKCCRPTIMTMIEASRLINSCPTIDISQDQVLRKMLSVAKDTEPIGLIMATLITGYEKNSLRGLYLNIRRKILARNLLNHHTCSELSSALIDLIARLEIKDFFAITTSLSIVNLTKQTKEVG